MASVALVSAAQLGMRWSMSRLPSPAQWLELHNPTQLDLRALMVVCASITAYALSMFFWLLALRGLPLSRAYSLLSISSRWFICSPQRCRFSTRRSRYRKLWVSP